MFAGFLAESIVARAVKKGACEINIVNLRDFGEGRYRKIDDKPYGGGPGCLMMCGPWFAAVESLKGEDRRTSASSSLACKSRIIMTSPCGKKFCQADAEKLAKEEHLIFMCGHYEGFDERIRTLATDEYSVGDFVMTGGELAAAAMVDSVVRLLPGVLGGGAEATANESFANGGGLEAPQYTHPAVFRGMAVPDVLLSGDHAKIDEWRRAASARRSSEFRVSGSESNAPSLSTHHSSLITPHSSPITPHSSPITPHSSLNSSPITPHSSLITHHSSLITPTSFDLFFMRMALREAEKAAADGEVPTGCVIVEEPAEPDASPSSVRILARAHNQAEGLVDATAHAEILALSSAFQVRGNWRLTGTRMYVTKEPCPMCAGAIALARIPTVVWGVIDPKRGGGSVFDIFAHPGMNHHPAVVTGVLEDECRCVLQEFFRKRRNGNG